MCDHIYLCTMTMNDTQRSHRKNHERSPKWCDKKNLYVHNVFFRPMARHLILQSSNRRLEKNEDGRGIWKSLLGSKASQTPASHPASHPLQSYPSLPSLGSSKSASQAPAPSLQAPITGILTVTDLHKGQLIAASCRSRLEGECEGDLVSSSKQCW